MAGSSSGGLARASTLWPSVDTLAYPYFMGVNMHRTCATKKPNLFKLVFWCDAQVRQLKAAGCKTVFREVASGAKTDRAQLRRLLAQLDNGDVLTVTPRRATAMMPGAPCSERANLDNHNL
jgi:Resolvase, N terminal domain